MRFSLILATLACSAVAFSQNPDSPWQIDYVSNLNQGDSYVNITNGGTFGAFLGLNGTNGDICANVYVFDPAQELLACCSCRVTPDGLNSFSVKNDLINHTLTPAVPTSVVIKIVSSWAGSPNVPNPSCKNSAASIPAELITGMRAWATTLHQNPQGGYSVTENVFQPVFPGPAEEDALPTMCGFVLAEGSQQFGFCNNACNNNGLSGAKK